MTNVYNNMSFSEYKQEISGSVMRILFNDIVKKNLKYRSHFMEFRMYITPPFKQRFLLRFTILTYT
jgi:hypothetical protein